MKKHFASIPILVALFSTPDAQAQFVVGASGLTIKAGTTVAINSLVLIPSEDLTIADDALSVSNVPIPGTKPSIKRVYSFNTGFSFTGTVGLFYQEDELGTNVENSLQIAYTNGAPYTISTGSTVNTTTKYISNTVSDITLKFLTAATDGPLPVSLANFKVSREGTSAVLSWSTTSESGSDYFEVERSNDVKNWQTIGRVNASGESRDLLRYHYIDAQLPASDIVYYRLKMTDKDRSFAYSAIRSLINDKNELPFSVFLFPNPSPDKIRLSWSGRQSPISTEIATLSGTRLMTFSGAGPANGIELRGLPSGVYLVRITDQNGRVYHSKFAKN